MLGRSKYKHNRWNGSLLWCYQPVSYAVYVTYAFHTNVLSICSIRYESNDNVVITCSTKVCSFGKQVVEKVETEYSRLENSRFVYRIHRSPMCEYMINFIQKLKHLPERYMMNSVLENFTILQVSNSFKDLAQIVKRQIFESDKILMNDPFPLARLYPTKRLKKRFCA